MTFMNDSACLITEVKQQWATSVLGWVITWCTTRVSDDFGDGARRPKPFQPCLG